MTASLLLPRVVGELWTTYVTLTTIRDGSFVQLNPAPSRQTYSLDTLANIRDAVLRGNPV